MNGKVIKPEPHDRIVTICHSAMQTLTSMITPKLSTFVLEGFEYLRERGNFIVGKTSTIH